MSLNIKDRQFISIRSKLIFGIMFVIFFTNLIVGYLSYRTAKEELNKSGRIILENSVRMVNEAIKLKNMEVEKGLINLNQAQEDIKEYILGPMRSDGTRPINKNIDLGEHGYIFILDDAANEIAHPSIEGQNTWNTKDMSGDDVYVGRDIIKKAKSGGGFTYYSWKYPYSDYIAKKVSYAEFSNEWDWIIVSSIYMDDFNRGANHIFSVLFLSLFITSIIGLVFTTIFSNHISRPINKINLAMKKFVESKYEYTKPHIKNNDETGLLSDSFEYMANTLKEEFEKRVETENKLKHLNLELESKVFERTKALEESLDELKLAQSRLIESNKMAALGNLVSGVAHEINTPLGNSITLASYVQSLSEDLRTDLNLGHLKKKDLVHFLDEVSITSSHLSLNFSKLSTLISTFKDVAVDKKELSKIKFNLKEQFDRAVTSVTQEFPSKNINILLNCPDDLVIESYPFSLFNIILNLLRNSFVHGFNEDEIGTINIDATFNGNSILIMFSDNGIGISNENVSKIFEPFFTTTRIYGHVGLGLHLVYNLVVHKLSGDIFFKNREPSGVEFAITFPV